VAFAKAVAAEPALNGVLTVEVYANAQLGDDVNLLKGCMKATIDGALVGSSIMSNIVPELGIVNAPYLFRDAVQARLVLNGPAGLDFARVSAKNLCQCWPGARTGCVTSPPIGRCERPSICTASRSASHNPM
jgi:TRAP-type C4-dicarboxylate transport system substrate-binding protein